MAKKRLFGIWVMAIILILLGLDFLIYFNSFPYLVGFLLPLPSLPQAFAGLEHLFWILAQLFLLCGIIISCVFLLKLKNWARRFLIAIMIIWGVIGLGGMLHWGPLVLPSGNDIHMFFIPLCIFFLPAAICIFYLTRPKVKAQFNPGGPNA